MSLGLANLVVALFLTGVIWVVQVVHHPLFAAVGRQQWTPYEAAHRTRITFVVAVPMLVSVALAAGWTAQAAVAVALVRSLA